MAALLRDASEGGPALSLPEHQRNATKSGAFRRLMIAQDVGSAIMGPERGDIYFGSGDEAGRLAGTTKQQGHFFVLLPEMAALERATASAP